MRSKVAAISQILQRPGVSWTRKYLDSKIHNHIWQSLFVITWSASFGYQLYLYSSFFQRSVVDSSWGFGQIVAITVWAPCFAEYLNLEFSKYTPSPFYHAKSPLANPNL